MPLSSASLSLATSWQLSKPNTGWQPTQEGPDSLNFNLQGILTTTFNQIATQYYSVASAGTQTIDCTSLTNLVNESFSFGHVLLVMMTATTSNFSLQPGASNGLTWFFSGTTPAITVPAGGCFVFSGPSSATGTVVDATHKTLLITNTGGVTGVVKIVIIGSTT